MNISVDEIISHVKKNGVEQINEILNWIMDVTAEIFEMFIFINEIKAEIDPGQRWFVKPAYLRNSEDKDALIKSRILCMKT